MNTLSMNLGERSYTITVGRGLLERAGEYFNLNRKVFLLTDSGVPEVYARKILPQCRCGRLFTVPQGEKSKSMATLEAVLTEMMRFEMTRGDVLVALGGGVVGDLGGLAASAYMRGIDFYQIPTTLLAQVDSSIGGKCAVNLAGAKNIVGAFYQPRGVLIDIDTHATLPERLISAGLAESVKMALTSDSELFALFEKEDITENNIETVILRSLMIKKAVVEQDEREGGLRKILNFGHTLGHAIEAESERCGLGLYHGECVAIGMLPMCSEEVAVRLASVLKRLSLPTRYEGDLERALSLVVHDKKCTCDGLDVITVEDVGDFRIQKMAREAFLNRIQERMTRI